MAICDDEALCRSHGLELTEEYARQNSHLNLSFSAFSNAEDLLDAARKVGGLDLYIPDILIPRMSGIKLGVSLREARFDGKIIYLTASRKYIFDSFKARSFDYLLKPVKKDVFSPC